MTKQVALHLPEDLHEYLVQEAELSRRSLHSEILYRLERSSEHADRWFVWTRSEQLGMWVQVDKGSEEDMRTSLARHQRQTDFPALFAMSREGEPLPEPPDDVPPGEVAP